jgi:uncharacterized protein (TIGR02145 family)
LVGQIQADGAVILGRIGQYNVNAVTSGKLAPKGWHVPTDEEWSTLLNYLGTESVAGGKLKETGFTHWATPNTGATNETGFSALPGGARNSDGTFGNIGSYGYWWSSTVNNTTSLWSRFMGFNYTNVWRLSYNNTYGFNVRCVRD